MLAGGFGPEPGSPEPPPHPARNSAAETHARVLRMTFLRTAPLSFCPMAFMTYLDRRDAPVPASHRTFAPGCARNPHRVACTWARPATDCTLWRAAGSNSCASAGHPAAAGRKIKPFRRCPTEARKVAGATRRTGSPIAELAIAASRMLPWERCTVLSNHSYCAARQRQQITAKHRD